MLEKPLPKFCATCKHFNSDTTWCELHETAFCHEDQCSYWKQSSNTEEEILDELNDECEFLHGRLRLLNEVIKTVKHDDFTLFTPIQENN